MSVKYTKYAFWQVVLPRLPKRPAESSGGLACVAGEGKKTGNNFGSSRTRQPAASFDLAPPRSNLVFHQLQPAVRRQSRRAHVLIH